MLCIDPCNPVLEPGDHTGFDLRKVVMVRPKVRCVCVCVCVCMCVHCHRCIKVSTALFNSLQSWPIYQALV